MMGPGPEPFGIGRQGRDGPSPIYEGWSGRDRINPHRLLHPLHGLAGVKVEGPSYPGEDRRPAFLQALGQREREERDPLDRLKYFIIHARIHLAHL